MKEISYKCDICKQNREEGELLPYYIKSNGEIVISGSIEQESKHICDVCIDIIYRYREDQIKEIDTIERERGA
jgi:hypothetical protein